jgi:hypothetical protein
MRKYVVPPYRCHILTIDFPQLPLPLACGITYLCAVLRIQTMRIRIRPREQPDPDPDPALYKFVITFFQKQNMAYKTYL